MWRLRPFKGRLTPSHGTLTALRVKTRTYPCYRTDTLDKLAPAIEQPSKRDQALRQFEI